MRKFLQRLKTNRKIVFGFLLTIVGSGFEQLSFSQQTIFSENIGTPTGTTAIAAYATGTAPATFQNKNTLSYVGTSDVRSTNASSGYTGASGNGNIFFNSTSGLYFTIYNINTSAFNSLNLSVGLYKSSNGTFSSSGFVIEVATDYNSSTNTGTFTALSYANLNGSAGWNLITPSGTIPSSATLAIRFRQNQASTQIRVDDIKLSGTPLNPTTTSISPSSLTVGSGAFTLTVNGTNFISGLSTVTWNGSNRTTTFVNSTQLTAAINASDITTTGTATVGVTTTGAASPSNTQTFTINAAGVPALSITGTPTNHGTSCVGTPTSTVTYTITNSGTAASGVTVVSDNADFVVSNLSSTSITGSGGTATYDVTFTPSAGGSRSATITVASTTPGSNSPTSSLTGTGQAPVTPVITSSGATSVVNTTATLNGNLSTVGVCPASTLKGFVYSQTGVNNDPINGGTGVTTSPGVTATNGVYTLNLTGLTPNTSYSFKAYEYNGSTYIYSTVQTFTTLSVADHLAFNPAPAGTGNVSTNLTSFTVEARRADNSVDVEFTGTINLARNIVSGTANLAGTTSLAATAGVATFNAVQFDNSGTYTITASSGSLTAASSSNISISLAPTIIYQHNFATGGTTSTYTISPNLLDPNLSTTGWTNKNGTGAFIVANGNGNVASSLAVSTIANTPFTLTLSVASGYQLSISSFNFWRFSSAASNSISSITVNGTTITSSSISIPTGSNANSGALIGQTNVANSVSGLTGAVTIEINLSGSSGSFRLDDFTLYGNVTLAPPIVTSFTPLSAFNGSTVTITGANFTGATAVSFGGTPATSFTVDNATQITAVVGAGSTGTVSVTTPAGTGTSAGTFTFNSGYVSNIAGNWSSGATWLGGAVPPANSDVTIANAVTLDQNFTVGSGNTFTVATGGSLVIADNATLDMADNTGIINFNGQPVTVKSTSSGTGSIGRLPGALSGATNVTVERYIPQHVNRAWRFLAANTSGQTIKNAWQEGQAGLATNTTGYGTMITAQKSLFSNDLSSAQLAGFDTLTPGSSILYFDQPTSTLMPLLATTVNIETHPSYFLYIRGDRSESFVSTTNTTASTDVTLRSTGTIAHGDKILTVPASTTLNPDGFEFLGNPFASAIDMRTVMLTRNNGTDINISEDFYVWDPKVGGLGGYQTFTRNGTNYVVTPGGGSYEDNNGSLAEYNNVESGAGFIVSNTGTSPGSITIEESAKVSASRNVQRPAGTLAVPGMVKTNLYAMNTGAPVLADGNLVLVDDSYSNNVDRADARKFTNFSENFAIEKAGNLLVVEKRNAFVESDVINFSMNKLKTVAYRLEIITTGIDAGLVAYLDDSYTKIQTPLSNQGTSSYDFTVTTDAASAAANRFQIVFKSLGGALPVSFIKFAATKANNDVVLDWTVGNQQGVSKYEVEKSLDGSTFVTVASVSAVDGQDVYSWTDNNVIEPKLYYRVKAVEADGSSKLTDIASIVTNKKAGIKLVTNLARANEAVKLEFVGQQAGKYNIRLVNSLGQVMYRNFISYVGGSGYQQFTIPSQLAGGAYQLEIVTPGKTKSVQRLVIQ